jgi:primosomal protein DnaI
MGEFNKNSLREKSVKSNFLSAMNDLSFKRLAKSLNVNDDELMKNTSKIQDTISELDNCKNCPGLAACKNHELGCVNYPSNYNSHIVFSYVACKYKKEFIKKENSKNTEDKILNEAQMKDIDVTDKKRVKLIKWVTNFIKSYDPTKKNKGLYLHGNFGCGKTYIISAMFNELKHEHYKTEIVYYPTLLRDLKANFDAMNDTINYLETVDVLLIDDIGAEKVSEWSRDEVLGTILQSRMNNALATFFTSNFNINELEEHMSNNGADAVKAGRIIERIKQLTEDMEIISINRRN